MSQTGKVALITGGAQGIGRSFAESLLAEGAKVALCDLKADVGETTAQELSKYYHGKVVFLQCDVTNARQLEDCFRSTKDCFGGLDLVINNAGIGKENEGGWIRMVDVNLVAVVRGTQLGMKYMGNQHGGFGGTIVNIASITSLEPFPSLPVYSATKAAVNQYSRSMGSDLYYLKSGVKVMSINPGMTKTMLVESAPSDVFDDEDMRDHFVKIFSIFPLQDVSNMGKGLIEVLKRGQNGSVWLIENNEPPKLTILK